LNAAVTADRLNPLLQRIGHVLGVVGKRLASVRRRLFGESQKEQQVPVMVEKAGGSKGLTPCAALGIAIATNNQRLKPTSLSTMLKSSVQYKARHVRAFLCHNFAADRLIPEPPVSHWPSAFLPTSLTGARHMTLTQERLKELAHYDPETGAFTALTNRCNNRYKAGTPLGGITGYPNRYYVGKIDGKAYGLHRLAWLYVHGILPDVIDHKDRNPLNNRIANLRVADTPQNAFNMAKASHNTSGVKGVTWRSDRSSWEAIIIVRGRRVYRRLFKDFDEACRNIREARVKYHGEFANHG